MGLTVTDALVRKLDVPGPRYTSYPTVPAWDDGFGPLEHGEALARAARVDEPLSLYVHIPFCHSLCSYCGCYVIVTREQRRVDHYLAALAEEARLVAERLGKRRRVTRVHFGGGTPTFLDERQLARLWGALGRHFTVDADAEVAIEVNPTGTRASQLQLLGTLGFNRLSIGVQDFDPEVQRAVDRHQTFEETRATVETARASGFASVNVDLIYGLPRQSEASFARTIDQVLALEPERLAIFSFAYLPSLRPHQKRLSQAEMANGAAKLRLFVAARERLLEAGYLPVGMDHFARADDPLAHAAAEGRLGRDFQGYTIERAPHTIGLGVSSISNLGEAYAQNKKSLGAYEQLVEDGWLPTERGIVLDEDDQRRRAIIGELMCNFAVDLGAGFAKELASLQPLVSDGIVEVDGARVRVTPLGRLFVRNVAMCFDAHLTETRPFSQAV